MRAFSLICILAIFPGFCYAQNLSGNELLETCEAQDDLARFGFCIGYISGVIEGMKWGVAAPLLMSGQTAQEADKTGGMFLGFCSPEGGTLGQYKDVVVLYLRNNPAERHNTARTQVQSALSEVYPCE
jgi:hypothetical protein